MNNVMNKKHQFAVLMALAVSWSFTPLGLAQERGASGRYRPGNSTSLAEATSLSEAFRAAADKIVPSVVKVLTTTKGNAEMFMNLRGFPFPVEAPRQQGLGSGVIIDSSGIILTNNHVVKSADEIVIVLHDGTELYATEFTTDPLTDLAIVRVHPKQPLPAAKFGDSDALRIGDWVLAVGHPLELETSVSAGIISAKGRSLAKVRRAQFLQTDAAINPGNSGGPLVNLRGEIVGINTAIASQTGGYQGIGFAVPANLARDVQRQLGDNGRVRRAYLGVSIQRLTRDLSQQLIDRPGVGGVLVNGVNEDTPAEAAGLRRGDVITHFADQPVDSPYALQRAVERVPIGSTQRLRLLRFGKPLAVTVNTLEFGREGLSREVRGEQTKLAAPAYGNSLGFEVDDLADLARLGGVPLDVHAVVVTRVDRNGLAAEERLRPGMIILQVRDREVQTVAEFKAALQNQSLSEGILLLVRDTRNPQSDRFFFVVLKSRS